MHGQTNRLLNLPSTHSHFPASPASRCSISSAPGSTKTNTANFFHARFFRVRDVNTRRNLSPRRVPTHRDQSRQSSTRRDKPRQISGLGVGTRPHHSTTARPLRFPHAAFFIVAVASAHQGRQRNPSALLTRRLPTARATLTLERCSGRSSYQPTDLRLCLRKTRGRKLPARSTSRSNSSARPRSFWSSRRRRRPRGARATHDA